MLRVLRFQAEIAGLTQPANRARLWPPADEDEFGEVGAGEAHEAGTEPGPLAEAVRQGHARAERALARHRESREELETQEGFDEAAHEEAARSLAAAVEERTRLPVSFDPPPPPANDLPPADDPPEEAYEHCPWAPDGTATRTGPTTTGPTAPSIAGSTSAATTTTKSTTPGRRRNAKSASGGTGSNATNGATTSTTTMTGTTAGRETAGSAAGTGPAGRTGRRTANSPRTVTSHDIS